MVWHGPAQQPENTYLYGPPMQASRAAPASRSFHPPLRRTPSDPTGLHMAPECMPGPDRTMLRQSMNDDFITVPEDDARRNAIRRPSAESSVGSSVGVAVSGEEDPADDAKFVAPSGQHIVLLDKVVNARAGAARHKEP